MVYCGKASQGCQSCRTRRIKCDKKHPECSQCIRVGKRCPGYRDQLSLLFRDESSKVIQKAHAQWGTGTLGSSADGGSPRPVTPITSNRRVPYAPAGLPSPTPTAAGQEITVLKIPRKVEPNLDQRGLKFYVERYLLNHPDSPRTPELIDLYFGNEEAIRNVMVAVGLAGMSNLLGNKSMNLAARSKYVTALKQTGQLIASTSRDPRTIVKPLRSIVTLALFEVVQGKGSRVSAGSANTHVHGAVALARSVLPSANSPNGGARSVLQLMFSMLIPSQMTDTPLPPGFIECLKLCKLLLQDCIESCAVDLAFTCARLLQLLLTADQATSLDSQQETNNLIQQFLAIETEFDRIELQLHAAYPFVENQSDQPSPALFRAKWHSYSEIWGARIWNHFRWARLLLGEYIIKFTTKYPRSSARHIPPPHKIRCYSTIERIARDMLISTPSHWHHPILDEATAKKYGAPGKGGAGAAGLPSLLWHLKVSACAPNVPPEFWNWAYDILQVVWKSMGMQHAQALAEVMEEHRKTLQTKISDRSPVVVDQRVL
ncbi:hypothetical protein F4859DRAFT_67425 [Xylaria cf. heliscus]|nr:hypothetical protein F4859DRAFT_67425 [Xylaria cf. heliscus]